ncbi:cistern family PEP-CTERM protein, partial [Tolypothrix sp. VBCCA 56010]|uniref:cistern family PEP-CTERM protein n=1 Tax=Tolypothrix sp. VBCCA 56010 TaxID=3137731 RepID=UPI003D7E34F4
KEKAEKEAADKVEKEKAEKEAADKAAKEKAEKEAADKVEKEKAEKEAADKAANGSTSTRPLPIINFSLSDVGKTFQFNFDGSVATQNVTGLTSTAFFTLKSFNGTEAAFDVNLDNTSSNGIKSRTSALGFNVYSDLTSTNKLDLASGKTTASGLFSNSVLDGSFPNQFGDIDVCFTQGNTCQGGRNGGVSTDDGIGKFSFNLAFNKMVDSFALGNLGVRYQSIEGTSLGTSGTGQGKYYQAPPPPPKKVPEPSTTAALGLLAVGALKALKKKTLKQD